jgi:hypothetical protein
MKDIPAFPTQFFNADKQAWIFDKGMTLRDYFAAQALTGAQVWDAVLNGKNSQFIAGVENLAEVAYAVADAMMKAREL